MSARLRSAVRTIIREIEVDREVTAETVSELRLSLLISENNKQGRLYRPATAHLLALAAALRQFQRSDGPHFVGCPAQRERTECSGACRDARHALHAEFRDVHLGVVDALHAEMTALREERNTAIRLRAADRKYFARVLKRARSETGFVMRGPGRPRKTLAEHKGTPALTPP